MRPGAAAHQLEQLREQAQENPKIRDSGPEHERWQASVLAVMAKALPPESATPVKFSAVRYGLGLHTGAPGESERARSYFASQVDVACGLIEAAIFELELESDGDPLVISDCDPDLWRHVAHSVEQGAWAVVASSVATFVEDQVRTWCNCPKGASGSLLVGQALFSQAFSENGPLRLGAQSSEIDGWRNLAFGFAGALSNVDRHRVQERDDLRRYALGVLGVGSLLLTQVKYEHPELVSAARTSC